MSDPRLTLDCDYQCNPQQGTGTHTHPLHIHEYPNAAGGAGTAAQFGTADPPMTTPSTGEEGGGGAPIDPPKDYVMPMMALAEGQSKAERSV